MKSASFLKISMPFFLPKVLISANKTIANMSNIRCSFLDIERTVKIFRKKNNEDIKK